MGKGEINVGIVPGGRGLKRAKREICIYGVNCPMIRRKVAWFAHAASFLVYLIPLVTPHGVWLLGQA